MLDRIHTGHQGITKCRERARQSIWWPGLSKQLEEMVKCCTECCKVLTQRFEPLIPSCLPELPWQEVGTDLFEWKQNTYLLIVDYYSDEVIVHTKSIFTRHGIPEIVVSNNGPQYSSEAFAKFARKYQTQVSVRRCSTIRLNQPYVGVIVSLILQIDSIQVGTFDCVRKYLRRGDVV